MHLLPNLVATTTNNYYLALLAADLLLLTIQVLPMFIVVCSTFWFERVQTRILVAMVQAGLWNKMPGKA